MEFKPTSVKSADGKLYVENWKKEEEPAKVEASVFDGLPPVPVTFAFFYDVAGTTPENANV